MAEIDPFDHDLIERIRKANKALSMFVFVLQENKDIPVDGQRRIANMLVALAEVIESRATRQPDAEASSSSDRGPAHCMAARHEP